MRALFAIARELQPAIVFMGEWSPLSLHAGILLAAVINDMYTKSHF